MGGGVSPPDALGLLARLQAVLQRSLHLSSAGNGGVQQQAGSSGGAQVQGVFPSLGEQEDSGSPGTLWRSCRHLGGGKKGNRDALGKHKFAPDQLFIKCKEALFSFIETSVLL